MKLTKEIGRNARVDWIVILLVSTMTLIVLALNGVYLYNAVVKGNIQGSAASTKVSAKKFSEKDISSVIGIFDEREAVSEKARAKYTGLADPSL